MIHSAYLSFGSNIRPQENIPKAVEMLSAHVSVLETSSAWHTKAVGTIGPDFVNMAVHIKTRFTLDALKEDILCRIEEELGRVRTTDKFAPRPIDIDITLFDGEVVDPNIVRLDYLVLPLSELLPDFSPQTSGKTLGQLAAVIQPDSSATRLPQFLTSRNADRNKE